MSKPLNIQGRRFGKLTAIRWTGNRNKDGKYLLSAGEIFTEVLE